MQLPSQKAMWWGRSVRAWVVFAVYALIGSAFGGVVLFAFEPIPDWSPWKFVWAAPLFGLFGGLVPAALTGLSIAVLPPSHGAVRHVILSVAIGTGSTAAVSLFALGRPIGWFVGCGAAASLLCGLLTIWWAADPRTT